MIRFGHLLLLSRVHDVRGKSGLISEQKQFSPVIASEKLCRKRGILRQRTILSAPRGYCNIFMRNRNRNTQLDCFVRQAGPETKKNLP